LIVGGDQIGAKIRTLAKTCQWTSITVNAEEPLNGAIQAAIWSRIITPLSASLILRNDTKPFLRHVFNLQ
jgi:hypothetical protein